MFPDRLSIVAIGRPIPEDSDLIRKVVRSTYEARVRGDLEGTLAAFADDVVFEFNG